MSDTEHDACACREYNELSRRQFVAGAAAITGGILVEPIFPAWLPKVVLAESADSTRDIIVSVFLRGGSDGLSLVVPFFDDDYYAGRPTLAVPRPDSAAANRGIALDDRFAFPQAMAPLIPAFVTGELLAVHATGSVDSSRSHFDAQRFMEVGKPRDPSVVTGWLGRHLASTEPMRTAAPLRALGLSSGLQKTLVGAPRALPVPDPTNFNITGSAATRLERMAWLRDGYASAAEPIASAALNAVNTIELLRFIDFAGYHTENGAVYPNTGFGRGLRSTAALIKADVGVEAIQVDLGGWDTHSNQDPLAGSMANTMLNLANSLAAFHADVIAGGLSQKVTVVVLSEFGRNVRQNGSLGTDHGRGNCMFLLGRDIAGGRVLVNNWPGLARENLERGQDLVVTIDHRDILAEIVRNRLGNPNTSIVFPDYSPTTRGVTRS
ncbi:MAG TPA: DUF1501 domain-containing protein [Longimicrobiales bacterium]|nr:DUF1501 domain-containing protein [Longimicrobiales bacterium]